MRLRAGDFVPASCTPYFHGNIPKVTVFRLGADFYGTGIARVSKKPLMVFGTVFNLRWTLSV